MTRQVFLLTNDSEIVPFHKANTAQLDLDVGISQRLVLDKKGNLINVVTPASFLETIEQIGEKWNIKNITR